MASINEQPNKSLSSIQFNNVSIIFVYVQGVSCIKVLISHSSVAILSFFEIYQDPEISFYEWLCQHLLPCLMPNRLKPVVFYCFIIIKEQVIGTMLTITARPFLLL